MHALHHLDVWRVEEAVPSLAFAVLLFVVCWCRSKVPKPYNMLGNVGNLLVYCRCVMSREKGKFDVYVFVLAVAVA